MRQVLIPTSMEVIPGIGLVAKEAIEAGTRYLAWDGILRTISEAVYLEAGASLEAGDPRLYSGLVDQPNNSVDGGEIGGICNWVRFLTPLTPTEASTCPPNMVVVSGDMGEPLFLVVQPIARGRRLTAVYQPLTECLLANPALLLLRTALHHKYVEKAIENQPVDLSAPLNDSSTIESTLKKDLNDGSRSALSTYLSRNVDNESPRFDSKLPPASFTPGMPSLFLPPSLSMSPYSQYPTMASTLSPLSPFGTPATLADTKDMLLSQDFSARLQQLLKPRGQDLSDGSSSSNRLRKVRRRHRTSTTFASESPRSDGYDKISEEDDACYDEDFDDDLAAGDEDAAEHGGVDPCSWGEKKRSLSGLLSDHHPQFGLGPLRLDLKDSSENLKLLARSQSLEGGLVPGSLGSLLANSLNNNNNNNNFDAVSLASWCLEKGAVGNSNGSSSNSNQAASSVGSIKKSGKRLLPCGTCGKEFDRPSLLERHIRIHTGERPYVCDFCEKGFSTSSSLNTHRRIHTGEKPHVCKTCGKCFTASSNLYYHRMTHLKEKPHHCKRCPKTFSTPGDLRNHMKFHSSEALIF